MFPELARSGEHHGLSILAESSSEHKDERERCSIARKNTFDYCPGLPTGRNGALKSPGKSVKDIYGARTDP